MKQLPIILIDSREKMPFDFEGDEDFASIKYEKLDAGDYSLEGMQHIIFIERKKNIDELFINFTKNKERLVAEFERSKDVKFRILVVEETLEGVLNPEKYYVNKHNINKQSHKMPVAVVMSGLMDLLLKQNVHIIFGGTKAKAITKGLLLQAYKLYK